MDIIQLLPHHIANQIAAGEVIQRPSSVVKELLENALDSGATIIKLFVKDAGKTLIQVVDNGCGMSETDAKMSFERHATSKIRKADDLFNIKTMGFRGEAMASMAAIAHVEICTKLTNEELGTKIIIEGSEIKNQEGCVCANGTSVKIKNLFFNVPARRNFLKSDKVESKHIIEQFTRIALANSEIVWSLYIDDMEYFRLEKSNFRQRIVNIIGTKTNEKLVPVEEETNLVKISGFVSKPEFSKRTRGEQYFFVNGRFIKNYYLNHAISKAFTDLIADGYHPSYFLNLKIDPKQIDINIHPTKTEIKFEDEKAIYAILRSAVKRSLGKYNIAPTLDFNTEPAFEIPAGINTNVISEPKIKVNTNYNPFETEEKEIHHHNIPDLIEENETNFTQQKIDIEGENNFDCFQIDNNFIVSNSKYGLIIIDQQRAHQRILFEHFCNNSKQNMNSQQLIFPEKLKLNKIEIQEITEMENELIDVGFQLNISSEKIEVTSMPSEFINSNIQNIFEEILSDNEIEKEDINQKIKSKIHLSLSRIISIKNGQKLTSEEMNAIVKELFNCETPSVNPTGLTTYFNVEKKEIEKRFKR